MINMENFYEALESDDFQKMIDNLEEDLKKEKLKTKENADVILFLLKEKQFSFKELLENSKLTKIKYENNNEDYEMLYDYALTYGNNVEDLEESIKLLKAINITNRQEILDILNNSPIYLIENNEEKYLSFFVNPHDQQVHFFSLSL